MTTLDAASFNLQLVKGFFDERQCGEIHHRAVRVCPEDLATVFGLGVSASVDQRCGRAKRLMPEAETVEIVRRRLSMIWGRGRGP